MADKSKKRMNLSAIKKVDPYAKDIVDSSAHVAFYTFNSAHNEWEKTDVEGAFFIYSRNALPYHSIFINNRLNTTSFVEPITSQLELQSQPPFLLYRNERSRIRGFWFYNSQECDRICVLVNSLVQMSSTSTSPHETDEFVAANANIFKMLSKAQQEYNNSQNVNQKQIAPCNVLEFFASAKYTKPSTQPGISVEQLEKLQLAKTPSDNTSSLNVCSLLQQEKIEQNTESIASNPSNVDFEFKQRNNAIQNSSQMPSSSVNHVATLPAVSERDILTNQLCESETFSSKLKINDPIHSAKPALMPPTMFDKPMDKCFIKKQEPLNPSQLVEAISYLINNDEGFISKLHEAYLKALLNSHQNGKK